MTQVLGEEGAGQVWRSSGRGGVAGLELAEGKEWEARAEPMYTTGKQEKLGTLWGREVCEWPLWIGTKWPERQRIWSKGGGKGSVG